MPERSRRISGFIPRVAKFDSIFQTEIAISFDIVDFVELGKLQDTITIRLLPFAPIRSGVERYDFDLISDISYLQFAMSV